MYNLLIYPIDVAVLMGLAACAIVIAFIFKDQFGNNDKSKLT